MAGVVAAESHLTEAKKLEYFSSINPMARKIMQEREKIRESFGSAWQRMSAAEQDRAIDDAMMEPRVRARYAVHGLDRDEVACYPKLLIQTGQKIVHFGDEDLTWQDEHSGPFSWETKSQMEFSVITGSSSEASAPASSSSEPKAKTSQQVGKLPSVDTPGPEAASSSFWKISAERSRLEGEKAEFQSLTPSQIKSLEKGEKPLPSYLRSDIGARETPPPHTSEGDTLAPRPVKQRVPKPPAPPPPVPISVTPAAISVTPAAISVTPAAISVTPAAISVPTAPTVPSANLSGVEGWERAQSTLPSVSSATADDDDVFSPGLASRPGDGKKADLSPTVSPTFSQFNTSSSILKTGFDFLDNW